MLFITPMRLAQVTVAHLKLKGSFDGPLLIQDFAQFDNWMLADLLPRASKIFDELELAPLAKERDAYIDGIRTRTDFDNLKRYGKFSDNVKYWLERSPADGWHYAVTFQDGTFTVTPKGTPDNMIFECTMPVTKAREYIHMMVSSKPGDRFYCDVLIPSIHGLEKKFRQL